MNISNNLKTGLFYGGVAALIVLAGEVIDYIVDTKVAKKASEKETKIIEDSEETETVEVIPAEEDVVETGKFTKGVAKIALTSAILSVACLVSNEHYFKSGVIGGAYYFTRIGATNEQAGSIISDKTKFSEVLRLLRKAR